MTSKKGLTGLLTEKDAISVFSVVFKKLSPGIEWLDYEILARGEIMLKGAFSGPTVLLTQKIAQAMTAIDERWGDGASDKIIIDVTPISSQKGST